MLTDSHPNPWLYAGILERVRWDIEPNTIERWDGQEEDVYRGDTMVVLLTPSTVVFVGVERS